MTTRPTTHVAALRASLRTLELADADKAVAKLALDYAERLDALGPGRDASRIGPAYLSCLMQLGLTPAARSATKGQTTSDRTGPSPLDELRARRARVNNAPAVDATTP